MSFDIVGVVALVLSVALWLFNPQPVRRFLGLEREPVEPIWVSDRELAVVARNQAIAPHLPNQPENHVAWIRADALEQKLGTGWAVFHVPERTRGTLGLQTTVSRQVKTQSFDHRTGFIELVLCWKPNSLGARPK